MKIVNTTPHSVVLIVNNERIVIPTSNLLIRLKEKRTKIGELEIDGTKVNINKVEYETTDLPPQQNDVYYIVSSIVANAFPNRNDLLIVDETIRDDKGVIIGCKSFAKIGGE